MKIMGLKIAIFILLICFATSSINATPTTVVNSDQTNWNISKIRSTVNSNQTPPTNTINLYHQNKEPQQTSYDEYLRLRAELIKKQQADSFEGDIVLNDREQLANIIIVNLKRIEIENGLMNPGNFTPSRHVFEVMDQIEKSKLFQIIRHMPKGSVLHAHDTAMCSTDFLIQLTYREHLWQCSNAAHNIQTFKFSLDSPETIEDCNWSRVTDARTLIGPKNYDNYLKTIFSLYTHNPHDMYPDINAVWKKFVSIFRVVEPIVTYAPVWKDYYHEALRQYQADGVQYLEFRGVLPTIYDLNGKIYSNLEVVDMYVDVLNQFKNDNPDFIGSKLIYAPWRLVSNETIEKYMDIILELYKMYPDFVAGYDFVGQEDLGRRLIDFVPFLLKLPKEIDSFFHAGETNWFGETDENLIDAVLLGTKRIGHGYALSKYPNLLKIMKEKGIVVEINPISNQVLKLVNDARNHPGALFFAENIPLVVSSDDYSFWETTPLSHDFYVAFLGIASSHSDLRTLKKLAINSLKYSSLNNMEKHYAFTKWKPKWDTFIENIITDNF